MLLTYTEHYLSTTLNESERAQGHLVDGYINKQF